MLMYPSTPQDLPQEFFTYHLVLFWTEEYFQLEQRIQDVVQINPILPNNQKSMVRLVLRTSCIVKHSIFIRLELFVYMQRH